MQVVYCPRGKEPSTGDLGLFDRIDWGCACRNNSPRETHNVTKEEKIITLNCHYLEPAINVQLYNDKQLISRAEHIIRSFRFIRKGNVPMWVKLRLIGNCKVLKLARTSSAILIAVGGSVEPKVRVCAQLILQTQSSGFLL